MISIEEYKKNPCGTLSIPYWKAQRITVPENMKIVYESEFDVSFLSDYRDDIYFRLKHNLQDILEFHAEGVRIDVITFEMTGALVQLINESYTHLGIRVSEEDVVSWTKSEVYCPDLWLGAFIGDKLVGAVISDYDSKAGEGIIEWLQVLSEYRNQGIAAVLVGTSVKVMSEFAEFATVSGKCDNITMPEKVYRRCGFEGNDVWHVLTRK